MARHLWTCSILGLCLSSGKLSEVTATERCCYGTGSLLETAVAVSLLRPSVVLGLSSVPLALSCPFSACSWLLATLQPLSLQGKTEMVKVGGNNKLASISEQS